MKFPKSITNKEINRRIFATRLREAMGKSQFSQKFLAAKLGCTPSSVSHWCQGYDFPKLDYFIQICRLLDTSADWLLGIATLPYVHAKGMETEKLEWYIHFKDHHFSSFVEVINTGAAIIERILKHHHRVEDVLKHFKISEHELATIVKATLQSGTLELVKVPRNKGLEVEISQLFDLKDSKVIVADIHSKVELALLRTEMVAYLAATQILPNLDEHQSVGIGSGYTMQRMAELSIPSTTKFRSTRWVPLTAPHSKNSRHSTANLIAQTLANRHADSEALYYPYVVGIPADFAKESYEELLRYLDYTSRAFTGINGLKSDADTYLYTADDSILPRGDIKEILGNNFHKFAFELLGLLFDSNGNIIGDMRPMIRNRNIYTTHISAARIKRIVNTGYLWLVAAGEHKIRPVFLALKNKLANALVIDTEIAENLVNY